MFALRQAAAAVNKAAYCIWNPPTDTVNPLSPYRYLRILKRLRIMIFWFMLDTDWYVSSSVVLVCLAMQSMMASRLMVISETQCTVLEVKVIEGLGTTIDVVLVNGVLHEGDTIVLCGMGGPIVTQIRSLLTPHPLKVCNSSPSPPPPPLPPKYATLQQALPFLPPSRCPTHPSIPPLPSICLKVSNPGALRRLYFCILACKL